MSNFSLEKEPFPEAGGDEFYFSTPALVARLDELCGAIGRGHVLLVDEQASGKTTLLDKFTEAAGERLRIFRLQARVGLSATGVVDELVSILGIPPREPVATELRDADTLLELFATRSQIAVIAIDDAHRLASSALEQLIHLAKRWERYKVRFLVCAEPGVMDQLRSLQEVDHFPGTVTTLDMPRFDHEQVGDYLHLCLFRAGLVGDSPFDPAIVATVTEKAHGLVGAIDPIARELMDQAGVQRRNHNPGARAQVVTRRWPMMVVAAAGLGVLLTVGVPASSTSQTGLESRRDLEVFRSRITLAPEENRGKFRERSASANSVAH